MSPAIVIVDYRTAWPDEFRRLGSILARHFVDDIEAYYDVKDPTFDLFMSAARQWADWTDWTPPASNA